MDDLQPGVRCEVRYGATPDFRAATITASDGTRLGVTYDTNEEEQNVARRRARLPGQRQRKVLAKGEAVDARHGSGEVRSATIKNIEGDTHTVVFDDDTTQELERRYVFGEWRDEPLAEGTKIECRYRDTATFYPGAVAKANDDGTHDITYDDGEAETGVILRRLRRPGQQQPENVDAGSRVDARRPDGGAVSPATVLGRENTTYMIRFDDGVTADVQRKHVFAAHVNASEGAADDATAAVARRHLGSLGERARLLLLLPAWLVLAYASVSLSVAAVFQGVYVFIAPKMLANGGAGEVAALRALHDRHAKLRPATDGLDDATRALYKQQAVVLLLLAIATAAMVGRSRPGRG